MDLEEKTLERPGDRCEECGAKLTQRELQLVLESYATKLPGLYLYFPSRVNLSPPLRAFVDLAREMTKPRKKRP